MIDPKTTKYELQNILQGKSSASYDPVIQAAARHLATSQRASPVAERKHQNKAKEAKKLIDFAVGNGLLIDKINPSSFIARGAEQKVYFKDDDKLKLILTTFLEKKSKVLGILRLLISLKKVRPSNFTKRHTYETIISNYTNGHVSYFL